MEKAIKEMTMEELNKEIEKVEEEKFVYLMTCDRWDSQIEGKYDDRIRELRFEKGCRVLKAGVNCGKINKYRRLFTAYFYNETSKQFEYEEYDIDFLRKIANEHGDERLWDTASGFVTNYIVKGHHYDDMCFEFKNETTINELLGIINKTLD